MAKYLERPDRDCKHAQPVASLWQRYRERAERNRAAGRFEPRLAEFRWLLEELKVSLFAQELKTPFPVSYKRLEKAWVGARPMNGGRPARWRRRRLRATVSSRKYALTS